MVFLQGLDISPYDLSKKKTNFEKKKFSDFLAPLPPDPRTLEAIFGECRWKLKNRLGGAISILKRNRLIPNMPTSILRGWL